MYPFAIPIGASYACQTESTLTAGGFSNPNRFMQIGNSTEEEVIANDMGSPVIQFTGIHVSVYNLLFVSHYTMSGLKSVIIMCCGNCCIQSKTCVSSYNQVSSFYKRT